MPTREEWITQDIFMTEWHAPLDGEELRGSFDAIRSALEEKTTTVHILFDLTQAGAIPLNSPYIALRSKFMVHERIGKVAVVGMDIRAEILADMVVKVTHRDIVFFSTYNQAMEYLNDMIVATEDTENL